MVVEPKKALRLLVYAHGHGWASIQWQDAMEDGTFIQRCASVDELLMACECHGRPC